MPDLQQWNPPPQPHPGPRNLIHESELSGQHDDDLRQLRILSIFYYLFGAVAALFGFCPSIHLIMGVVVLVSSIAGPVNQGAAQPGDLQGAPAALIGVLFIVVALMIMLTIWAFAACMIIAGRKLTQQKSYTFCTVMAGIACTFFPLGTLLGAFTLVVLCRPSAKLLFTHRDQMLCPRCNYTRKGSSSLVCPECGASLPAKTDVVAQAASPAAGPVAPSPSMS